MTRSHRSHPGLPTRATIRSGAVVAGVLLGVAALTGPDPTPASASTAPATTAYEAALDAVAANRVTGNGAAWVTVQGDQALVQIQVQGLLDGAPHGQRLHIGGQGGCPRNALPHNGQPSVSAGDGLPFHGPAAISLTVTGDTGPSGAGLVDAPTAGSYTYVRTVPLSPEVRTALADGTAVLVVSGVDYDGDGTYGNVLGASDLDPAVPAEATSPALCGRFTPMQMAGVPVGGAETGGGSTSATPAASAEPTHDATPAGWAVVGLTAALWVAVSRSFRRWVVRLAG